MPPGALRGFRDYLPPEAGARSDLFARMRSAARRCGYSELEAPAVESLDLYRAKSGEEIASQLWAFRDKGGREVALAPESTPSLARIYADRAKAEPLPVKWFTLARLWRYEEPQSGRTREFQQFNLDILGVPGVEAELDLLSSAALLLDEAGAEGLYSFRVSDRALAEGLGASLGATDTARFFRALDRQAKLPTAEFRAELAAAGLSGAGVERIEALLAETAAGVPASEVSGLLDRLAGTDLGASGAEGIGRLRRLFELVQAVGLSDRVVFSPSVVRGLAYYTGIVFEAYERAGQLRALFGGGRYDRLIELFGGPPTPACGLAIGDQTLELLLKTNDRWPAGEPPLDSYVVAVTSQEVPMALALVRSIRRAGGSADADLLGRSLSRQLKEAARRRARRALILGPEERAKGIVLERDLRTGTQRPLAPEAAGRPE